MLYSCNRKVCSREVVNLLCLYFYSSADVLTILSMRNCGMMSVNLYFVLLVKIMFWSLAHVIMLHGRHYEPLNSHVIGTTWINIHGCAITLFLFSDGKLGFDDRVCEICGAPAQNILGVEDSGFIEQWNDLGAENTTMNQQTDCWQSLSLCNFLLACMVVIFILLWLFRISIS